MAAEGESSLLDYSLEREGGHDEPLDSANLEDDPALSLRGGQKIRFKVCHATLQGLLSGPTSLRKSQSTLMIILVYPKGILDWRRQLRLLPPGRHPGGND
jgi:hypothetical protein